MEMSTLLTTASTSVAASQSGLPVSRAMRSANLSFCWRTTLAKRRRVSTRTVSGFDAQPAQAARAAETSASASPMAPVQSVSPVAGSVEISISVIRSGLSCWSMPHHFCGTRSRAAPHGLAHAADGRDLRLEQGPVVGLVDPRPDHLHLVYLHGAGRLVRPAGMVERPRRLVIFDQPA